jgi:integrase
MSDEDLADAVPARTAHARRYRRPRRRARAAKIGDLDESRKAWLVRAAVSKTRKARWVVLPDDLFAAVVDRLPAREDRDPSAPLFQGVTADRLRMAILRACRDAGVPHFPRTRSGIGGSACFTARASPGPRSATAWVSAHASSPPTATRTLSSTTARSTGRSCSDVYARCRPRCGPRSWKPPRLQGRSRSVPPI